MPRTLSLPGANGIKAGVAPACRMAALVFVLATGACVPRETKAPREAKAESGAPPLEPWRTPANWYERGGDEFDERGMTPPVSEAGADWSDAVFRLERRNCYGECPVYRVSIYPDNRVEYEGREHVAQCGKHVAWAEAPGHGGLVHAFRAAHYLSALFDEEDGIRITDQDSATTFVELSGQHRVIYHYAPALHRTQLTELEKLIDSVGGTSRWTRCAPEGCGCGREEIDFDAMLLHGFADAGPE